MHLPKVAAAAATLPWAAAVVTRQASTTVTVNLSRRYQTIDGFGFSEAFQRAYNIYNLAEPKRSQLIDLLFNTTSGAGFSIVRNGIGSSPNSSNDWMNTILPTGPSSPAAMSNASYVWDSKDSGQLWVSQQAVKYGVKTFYADAWSAPGFMKSNRKDSGGGFLCGVAGATCSSGDWRQAYADYLVKYIQFYQQSGVNVTHLGFLNEPDISTSYASMLSNGQQSADFIRVLYPTLQIANLSSVNIACCDATGWKIQATMTQGLKDAGVEDMIGIITSHTYTSGVSGTLPTSRKVWETECSDLSGGWSTAWYTNGAAGDGFTWANNIYTGLTSGNVSAYLWWVATQDKATNNNNNEKLILVDGGDYVVAKRFWAFAQYSRTIRPGATRVGISGGSNLKTTAFQNADGTVAVNVINSSTSAAVLSVAGVLKAASAKAWVTDASNDMTPIAVTVGADGSVSGVTVPGRGMVSFVISAAASSTYQN
ncbi:glycoside hydrolase superfamily [Diplogelasinospora grovesii]|uniref:Glycoside hydrolase superfamily n=1 Tax=Diplogelasinospora grovesii TaxID=303347 RepID=A0AAN6S6L4_9PEZI|nr:glycoside hydrolase superfamily [Diplogelasinospora grovesii]